MKNNWWKSGDPWIWLTASSVTISMIVVAGLLILIAIRGLGHFWPAQVLDANYVFDGNTYRVIGEVHSEESVPTQRLLDAGGYDNLDPSQENMTRYLIKTGIREHVPLDFRWVLAESMSDIRYPSDMVVLERHKGGNFYGYLESVKENGQVVASGAAVQTEFLQRLARAQELHEQMVHLQKVDIGAINYAIEGLRLDMRRLELQSERSGEPIDPADIAAIEAKREGYNQAFEKLSVELGEFYKKLDRDTIMVEIMTNETVEVPLANIVYAHWPNAMTTTEKFGYYFMKLWWFVSKDPREANTEGGIFPAIFGTVMMVFIMSVIVTPFGVIAAVYLREYAKQGVLTRTIRIAVNNLAGVPSIVYGVFGLGFFVYFVGSSIDELFFPAALPAPTFGTPGILWASLTLALLTLPVVIVSTEEGLSRIPKAIREGSLALGATKAETLWRVVLPMSSPAMMTGLILAIARAAGEVAPLMLVGVVKLAPSLVLDGNYPFLHLERKFMHLGFHIYDVGFQSPNVEAARPLVYATSFLLVAVIVVLNLAAIAIRNHLREKYKALETT